MLNYDCIIKEDHLDIRKLSENVKIPLSKEDEERYEVLEDAGLDPDDFDF